MNESTNGVPGRRRGVPSSALLAAMVWLNCAGGSVGICTAEPTAIGADKKDTRPTIAAIVTEYRPGSHADVILGRLIQGWSLDVYPQRSGVRVRSMYVDQTGRGDLSGPLGRQYGIPIAGSIREAILDENGELAVDGVVLIGEHGSYPLNERGQRLYPRRRFFDETVAAFREADKVVPIFNDKHLAADWKDAKHMYETAKRLRIPFMAGSSLPLAWRRPWLDVQKGLPIEEALAVGYGGIEAYGFHALETLQCMVERRRGGETGVRAVQALRGDAVWEAMEAGRFSKELLESALTRHDPPLDKRYRELPREPVVFLVEYRDGLRASVVMLPDAGDFLFAARFKGFTTPLSTRFWLQEPTWGHFSYLANAISELVIRGEPVYPVERTVLTTGVLEASMRSLFEKGRRIETPDLTLTYEPLDLPLAAFEHPEASNARDGGWIELFDGKSLDGWLVHEWTGKPRWGVKDGVLRGTGGKGYLSTTETFDDFELFAEVRIGDPKTGRGNSGIYFRCGPHVDQESEFPPGYEAQCDNGDRNNPTGSIYSLGIPGARAEDPGVKDGEWFTVRIRAEGDHLRTWVNGGPAADCRDPENRYRVGAILLQLHHATAIVEFRQVRIRRLGR